MADETQSVDVTSSADTKAVEKAIKSFEAFTKASVTLTKAISDQNKTSNLLLKSTNTAISHYTEIVKSVTTLAKSQEALQNTLAQTAKSFSTSVQVISDYANALDKLSKAETTQIKTIDDLRARTQEYQQVVKGSRAATLLANRDSGVDVSQVEQATFAYKQLAQQQLQTANADVALAQASANRKRFILENSDATELNSIAAQNFLVALNRLKAAEIQQQTALENLTAANRKYQAAVAGSKTSLEQFNNATKSFALRQHIIDPQKDLTGFEKLKQLTQTNSLDLFRGATDKVSKGTLVFSTNAVKAAEAIREQEKAVTSQTESLRKLFKVEATKPKASLQAFKDLDFAGTNQKTSPQFISVPKSNQTSLDLFNRSLQNYTQTASLASAKSLANAQALKVQNDAIQSNIAGSKILRENSLGAFKDLKADIINKVTTAFGSYSKAVEVASTKVGALGIANSKAVSTVSALGKGLLSTFGTLAFAGVALQFLTQFQQALKQGVQEALKLRKAIAEIQTISQEASLSTREWKAALIGLSSSFATPVVNVAAAAYQTLSNQVAHGVESISFLNEALTFAQVTNANAKESVDLLSSALNSFGFDASFTKEKAAELFKVIELGRVRADELGEQFGSAAILAGQLGITLPEFGAGIATISKQGVRTNSTLTLMRQLMLKLVKPTDEMKDLLNDWGVETGEAAIAAFGFKGVLEKLFAEVQSGGATRLGELTGRVRALVAVLGVAGTAELLGTFDADLNKISNSLESYNNAIALVNTEELKFQQELQAIANAFIEAGDSAAYFFNKIFGNNISETVGIFSGLISQLRDFIKELSGDKVDRGFLFPEDDPNKVVKDLNRIEAGVDSINVATANFSPLQASDILFNRNNIEKYIIGELLGTSKALTQEQELYNKQESKSLALIKARKRDLEDLANRNSKELKESAQRVIEIDKQLDTQFNINDVLRERYPILQKLVAIEQLSEKSVTKSILAAAEFGQEIEETLKNLSNISKGTSETDILKNSFTDLEASIKRAFAGNNFDDALSSLKEYNSLINNSAKTIQTDLVAAQNELNNLIFQQDDNVFQRLVEGTTSSSEQVTLLTDRINKLNAEADAASKVGNVTEAKKLLDENKKLIAQLDSIIKKDDKDFGIKSDNPANKLADENFNRQKALQELIVETNKQALADLQARAQTEKQFQEEIIKLSGDKLAQQKELNKLKEKEFELARQLNNESKDAANKIKEKYEKDLDFIKTVQAQIVQRILELNTRFGPQVQINPLGTQAKAVGGIIGGPKGRDNQFIRAHSGEFIVNSAATKKFYSQLVAINSGQQPRGFASGGIVNNIGDINVTHQVNESVDTAVREIAKKLRREIRRNNSRLN